MCAYVCVCVRVVRVRSAFWVLWRLSLTVFFFIFFIVVCVVCFVPVSGSLLGWFFFCSLVLWSLFHCLLEKYPPLPTLPSGTVLRSKEPRKHFRSPLLS